MYRAIFLDIDDTLLDFRLCSMEALSETFQTLNLDFTDEIYQLFQKIDAELWQKQKSGILSVEEVLMQRFQLFAKELKIDTMAENLQRNFELQLANTAILLPDAKEVIEQLSQQYILYAASNGIKKMQVNRLEKAQILHCFAELYVSDDVGFDKPNLNFFNECFKRCQLNPKEVLFVGDSLEADMYGAKNAGIDTCWFAPKNKIDTIGVTYRVDGLNELKAILIK